MGFSRELKGQIMTVLLEWTSTEPHLILLPPAAASLLILKKLFLIEGELLYNIVLVSAIYQHESAIGIHISLLLESPSHLPHHPTPLVVTEPQFEFPEPFSKFPLAICFTCDSVYVSRSADFYCNCELSVFRATVELERSGELRPNENASKHTVLTKIKLFALKNHYPDFWDLLINF